MNLSEQFEKETGLDVFITGREDGDYYSGLYVDWLENKLNALSVSLEAGKMQVNLDNATSDENSNVIFTIEPPSTGSQKCVGCGGWITSPSLIWINNNGPYCASCFKEGASR